MTARRCASCKHWDPVDTHALGQCLILPAKIISDPKSNEARLFYRTTEPTEWCDEWKENLKTTRKEDQPEQ